MIILTEPIRFQWDGGNREKSFTKHGITPEESEQAFFDPGKKILRDPIHSVTEKRYILIGKIKDSNILTIIFTQRGAEVRVISARRASKKEQHIYHP